MYTVCDIVYTCILYNVYCILHTIQCRMYTVYDIMYLSIIHDVFSNYTALYSGLSMYDIVYTVYHAHCTVYTIQQGSPTYGPRAKCGPFQKMIALFKFWGAKKVISKIWKEWLKNMSWWPSAKRIIIFPFFGTPITKGWRPLLYSIHYTVYNVHCTLYTV